MLYIFIHSSFYFFFNDTATTEIYTLSLHDALPISFATQIQAQINRRAAFTVVEKNGVDVGHVAAVLKAQNVAERQGFSRRLVPPQHEVHAAHQMNEQIAGEPRSVFPPAPPARKIFWGHVRIPGFFRRIALPGVPIEIAGSQVRRRWILPRAGGIVATVGTLDESERADDTVRKQLFCFGADDRADALRSNLHDAAGFFRRGHHGHAVGSGMRHGLFAVDVLSGVHRIDDNIFVPVIGNGGDDAVDLLVVEKFLIAARGDDFVAGDFFRKRVAAVPEIGGGDAFDAGELHGIRQQARALHADADDAETHAVARRR